MEKAKKAERQRKKKKVEETRQRRKKNDVKEERRHFSSKLGPSSSNLDLKVFFYFLLPGSPNPDEI